MAKFWIQQLNPHNGGWIDSVGFDDGARTEAERMLRMLRDSAQVSEYRLVERIDVVLEATKIVPVDKEGTRRMATIVGLTPTEVRSRIGFDANCDDDPEKVGASWGFTVDGVHCGVWYYKYGRLPSASGTKEALEKVFGCAHVEWHG